MKATCVMLLLCVQTACGCWQCSYVAVCPSVSEVMFQPSRFNAVQIGFARLATGSSKLSPYCSCFIWLRVFLCKNQWELTSLCLLYRNTCKTWDKGVNRFTGGVVCESSSFKCSGDWDLSSVPKTLWWEKKTILEAMEDGKFDLWRISRANKIQTWITNPVYYKCKYVFKEQNCIHSNFTINIIRIC